MRKFFFIISLIGAVLGAFIIIATMSGATSAPQEAAGYAMACAMAVVPYVLARSISMMSDYQESRDRRLVSAAEDSKRVLQDIERALKKDSA